MRITTRTYQDSHPPGQELITVPTEYEAVYFILDITWMRQQVQQIENAVNYEPMIVIKELLSFQWYRSLS